jgi:hypothetical protein
VSSTLPIISIITVPSCSGHKPHGNKTLTPENVSK